MIRLSRWAHTSSILGDGGVHFDPAACDEHLPLSFAASTQSQASTDCQPSAQPRPITAAPQTEAECTVIRLSRWAHPSSILGDGGVHFDPAACHEHLPLSFAASTQSQAST